MKRIPRFKSAVGWGSGMGIHRVKASVRARTGAAKKRKGEEVEGRTGSFMKSFNPSVIGWSTP